ncbi:MAG: hypothetical protein FJ220_00995, partial [Kiritimatiellaceae bacterium]|nr:hypothetical protein [Kiritimatiellaceae bacterium]
FFLHPEEAQQRSVLQIPVSVTIKKGKSGGSEQATLKLARQGFSMEEIAAQRGITVDTIAQHIEKLIDAGQGKYLVLDQLMKPARRMMIEELFRRAPQDSLKALQEASDHPVSYAELRIVRALMPKK